MSDIAYQPYPFDLSPPTFAYGAIPFVGAGVAFAYHVPGLTSTLRLSSLSICSIFTGAVDNWSDPVIQADNPGVTLPNEDLVPVIRTDLSGTNLALQQYCIDEQPALWSSFVNSSAVRSLIGQVPDLSATQARPDWPLFTAATVRSGALPATQVVNSDASAITAVEPYYALAEGLPVASVENASGDYTQPTAVNVDSALTYDSLAQDGTQTLDFAGKGADVYNPSTFEELMVPTTNSDSAKGAEMSQFVNYALTLGQQEAAKIGYAPLGLPLEQQGLTFVQNEVPGAVALTSSEQSAYQCGDLTSADAAAGTTSPTCQKSSESTTTTTTSTTPLTTSTSSPSSSGSPPPPTQASLTSQSETTGSDSSSGGLAFTGVGSTTIFLFGAGMCMFVVGVACRRRLRRGIS